MKIEEIKTAKLILKHYRVKKSYLLNRYSFTKGVYLIFYSFYHSVLRHFSKIVNHVF